MKDKKVKKATASASVAEPEKKSRGGLRDYSEAKAKTVERVRGEFLADTFKEKITIAYETVRFNMACVKRFSNCLHVSFSIDLPNKRLIVEPTEEYDKNGLKFANFKKGRNEPRICTTRLFCKMLFDAMKWKKTAKYRILSYYQEFGDKKVMVFNLDEFQEVFSETTEDQDGKKRRNTTIIMPGEWQGRFGYTMDELEEKSRIKYTKEFLTIDPKTREKRDGDIEPKPPTLEDLIHEPYGGTRARKKEPKKDD
jgi:hypothetical protein